MINEGKKKEPPLAPPQSTRQHYSFSKCFKGQRDRDRVTERQTQKGRKEDKAKLL